MTHFAAWCRIALASAVSLALASACGGSSYSNGGEDGGESGSGGTENRAGTHSTAGKSTAGTSSGGKSSGGTGSGGTNTGGSSPGGEACTAPAVTGDCIAYFESWYHDVTTGLCRPFVYGGCDGNANNYETFEECQKACPGGAPNYDACQAPTDCVVTGAGCCGICDGPGITRRDLIAYNRQYQNQVSGCNAVDIACGACAQPLPGQGSLMYFVPNCVRGQCVVEDIRTSAVTACEDTSECRLRNGTACCEGCGSSNVVSVRSDGSFEELVCGDLPQPCPACIALPPDDAVAVCTEGRCGIEYLPIGAKSEKTP